MAENTIKQLQSLISQLQADRQAHLDAITEIDAAFGGLGISPVGKKRGRPRSPMKVMVKGAGRAKRSTGHRFNVAGPESIVQFVHKAGSKGVTGAQIDRNWRSQGRAGSAYNILGQLVEAKRLTRVKAPGGRGSVYSAP